MNSPYRKGRKSDERQKRAMLNAAAFQDHMARLVGMPSGGTGPVSTTGVPGSGKQAEDEEVYGKGHRLTLAQKYGLVSAPRSKLDEYEWMEVHSQSHERGDVKHGCSICYEPFRGEDRVLLSCSHTFHKHCLQAFERFTKQRCCPMCRTLQYQKRVVASAREMYEEECAIVIQKYYRRHLAQVLLKKLVSMKAPTNPQEKVEWCAAKLTETNDKLLEKLTQEDDDIDALLRDLDRKIFFSRTAREVANNTLREPQPSPEVEASADTKERERELPEKKRPEIDWKELRKKAKRRKDKTCPICIGPLARKLRGNVCLLSCSHMFHEDCIHLFEMFQESEQNKPICPLCRSNYEKQVLRRQELELS